MSIKNLNRPVPRFLLDRLDRLQETLQTIGQRLRDSIAQVVGTQVGEAVRDALEGVLHGRQPQDRALDHHSYRPDPYRERDHLYDAREENGFWHDPERHTPEPMLQPERIPEPTPEPRPSRWKALLVGAVELATWWLRRGPQRPSLKKLLGAGAVVGLVTLVAG